MSAGLFTRLAADGIKKNKKLYIPYIISLAGMVAISYVLYYLTEAPAITRMRGASVLAVVMALGKIVMVVFSCLFLLYTNSFLAKRRNFEFALYNILGMNKRNVVRILLCETVMVGSVGLILGFATGILLSKLFELILVKMCNYPADYSFYLSVKSIIMLVVFYVAIMLILFIFSAGKIIINKPIELLRSTNAGEKEPKTNILFALGGIGLLGAAYYMAVTIEDPLSSLNVFFIAVLMVIVGTYMLFQAGSIFICKLLKKNKKYYYDPRHFVPVSGMIYRMKRNGAGLATICILATMVMVMLGSTGSLFFGLNSTIDKMYQYDINISSVRINDYEEWKNLSPDVFNKDIMEVFDYIKPEDVHFERYENFIALKTKNGADFMDEEKNLLPGDVANYMMVEAQSLDDYNKNTGNNLSLEDDEVYFLSGTLNFKKDVLVLSGLEYKVKGREEGFNFGTDVVSNYRIVVKDMDKLDEYVASLNGQKNLYATWGFDTRKDQDDDIEKAHALDERLHDAYIRSKAEERIETTEMYASLLLLGIFLSIVFMGACAFIIYFKQLTEGYEDAGAYKTMRSVGMTKKEIKKGINSQTLITFFSPLFMAAIHLAFSAPLVHKLMIIVGLTDVLVFAISYVICFAAFAIFYLFVYKKTVKAYVEIVSA